MSEQTPDPDPRTPRGDLEGASELHGPRQNSSGYFVAGSGVSRVAALTSRQRALDRSRLDEYAELLAAATRVTTSSELAFRSLRAELAAAMHVSEFTVERELDMAYTLSTRYPGTRDLLGAGLIGLAHVKVICDAGIVIGSNDDALLKHALYEEAVLAYAVDETPGRLRPIAKRLAEQFAEISLEERHEVARRLRRVEVYPLEDGMAELTATLPAEVAYAIRDRLQRISKEIWQAEACQAVVPDGLAEFAGSAGSAGSAEPGSTAGDASPDSSLGADPRSLDEVRADTLAEIMLMGNPYTNVDLDESGPSRFAAPGFFAQLQVTVPVEALTSANPPAEAPEAGDGGTEARPVCELAGYGPISTRVAAELLETSRDIYRLDHDRKGQILRVERYTPTKQMRRLIEARDKHCRFPGCTRVPMRCEIDHTIAWQDGGPTSTDNLECLCKGHHVLKHHSAWTLVLDSTGTVKWTSPSGRNHEDRLASRTETQGVAEERSRPPGLRGQVRLDRAEAELRSRSKSRVRFIEIAPDPNDPNAPNDPNDPNDPSDQPF